MNNWGKNKVKGTGKDREVDLKYACV